MAVDQAARLDPGGGRQIAACYRRVQIGRVMRCCVRSVLLVMICVLYCAQLQILQ